jgi:hypothetical protein
MHLALRTAALVAILGGAPALAQYDVPLSRPAATREIDDPKPVYNYELQPKHGEFLVCVKSFPGEIAGSAKAKLLAEGLAEWIRSECRLYAYVHESGWAQRQERKKEKEAYIAAKRKYLMETMEIKADQITEKMLEVKMARIPDEYSVFVAPGKGTLKTMDEAIAFAKYVHKLPAPPAEYCESIVIGSVQDVSKRHGEPQNPFPMAMAGRNRTLPKKDEAAAERPKADEFLLRLNAGQPYSLIHQTKKPYTLVVQTYGSKFMGRVVRPGGVVQMTGKTDGEMLERAAHQAHAVAEALRKMSYKAYVLHTRYESFVCIGEYDSEKDPELLANAKAFAGLPLKDEKKGLILETFMDKPMPAIIPRP